MFKVGDKVKRVKPSNCPKFWGVVGKVYTVLSVTFTGGIQIIDKRLTDGNTKTADPKNFELVADVEYEDSWILNDGKTIIPDDAKTLKDTTSDIVAYKLVKKPKVKEVVRWASDSGNGTSDFKDSYNRHKVVFVVTDDILTDIRLEKD